MKKIILIFYLTFLTIIALAQKTETVAVDTVAISNTPAKSGLSYDALTQFFQTNITSGTSGGYDFKATLFAIKKIFSSKNLDASAIYFQNKHERNLEFALGLHKGKDGNLNLLMGGFKYALINRRDPSGHNFLHYPKFKKSIILLNDAKYDAEKEYKIEITNQVDKKELSKEEEKEMLKELRAADYKFHDSHNIKDYPESVQELYRKYLKARGYDSTGLFKSTQDIYDSIAKNIEMKALLTVSFNPGYDWNNSRFDTTTINIQYLKGFGNFKKPWNIDLKATQLFQHDSTSKQKDLSRLVFIATLGINKVLVYDSKLNPLIELELAYENDYIENGLYIKEEKNQPKIVNTLRVHLTKEISLPVSLKYDLKKPNLLGFFRLQWDLVNSKKN